VGNSADKLVQRMRQSKVGWGAEDLHKVYLAHGFSCRQGGKHVVYTHVEHSDLMATVPRHGSLAQYCVAHLLKLVDILGERSIPPAEMEDDHGELDKRGGS